MFDGRTRRSRRLAAAVSVLAGVVVFVVATGLFPYHSVNDDEAVYLTQAAMLLDGQLFLHPGSLGDLVRPWFFVSRETATGLTFYPKYAPVPAAFFALGQLAGEPRYALAFVAAGNTALVYALTAAGFDRRTGLIAAVALVGSPLFLLSSSVFLPYAPTTLLNLTFAFAYVLSIRRESRAYAPLAGGAVGLAFFSRPYTAVLFAAPFVVHALVTLWRAAGSDQFRTVAGRTLAVALPGLAGVGVTLGYNALVTGDPLLFPYEAFAPRDGLGFGRRELLGHSLTYTPALAARTTLRLVTMLLTEWTVAGPLGTLLAAIGLLKVGRRPAFDADALSDRDVRWLIAGLFVTVTLGNAYFWGSLNGLENGLFDLLGPYYHFDLLVPLSAFAAAGVVRLGSAVSTLVHTGVPPSRARILLAAILVLSLPVVAVAEQRAVSDPVEDNRLRTETLAATYEPFERQSLSNAVVFVPPAYGEWLHHPFQRLRNDPGFDGRAVYVLDEGPDDDFRALDATGGRRPYRFTYRGEWTGGVRPVEPALEPLSILDGGRVRATTTVGVPARATRATVRVETAEGYVRHDAGRVNDSVTVRWAISPDGVRVAQLPRTGGTGASLPPGASEVTLLVTFVEPTGTTVTYRQEVSVDASENRVRAVWPPETRICRLTTDCGREGTYVGPDGTYLSGVTVETTANATAAAET